MFTHKNLQLEELNTVEIDGKRFYNTPVGPLPSITTVLSILSKDGIEAWKKSVGEREANKISRMAAERGTAMHSMCEDYLNNELDMKKYLPHVKDMFLHIKPILNAHVGEIYAQEVPLWSKFLGIAGRVDLVADWNGRLSIIDFKTSRRIKEEGHVQGYFQQASAYAVMFEERTGIPVDQIVILISVENYGAQVFVEKRDDHIWNCINTIKTFKEQQ